MIMSGAYTSNIYFFVSGSGAMNEHYMMAYYANSIGMGAAMPLVLRLKMRFKIRDKLTVGYAVLALLNFINGTTDQPYLIIINSLLIGFVKMIVNIEFFIALMAILSPNGERLKFYAIFYPFVITVMQLANYYSVYFSIAYNWEYFYILLAGLSLFTAILCWLTMHNQYFGFKTPLHYIDWLSVIIFNVAFLLLAYVLAFGKQQDWLNSNRIIEASIAILVLFIVLILRQFTQKRPYLSFKVFKKTDVLHGIFMLMCLGMFLGLSSLQNTFAINVLGYDQLSNAKLILMMIPGILTAGIVCKKIFNDARKVKFFVFSGFASLLAYSIILYFSFSTEFAFNNWYLPMFLKGYGMCALYIGIWFYILNSLPFEDMMPAIGFILVIRSFLTIGFFSSVFSWMQYSFQIESLTHLATYSDAINSSVQNTSNNLSSIKLNALLVANKRIMGYVIITGFLILIYVLFHHFGIDDYKYSSLRKRLKRKSFADRRRIVERAKLQIEIEDAAGAAI